MDWRFLTCMVCLMGFFRDLRPSEAYLTDFLTSEWKNLTITEVNSEIYPWWTYSYTLWLIPVLALTDYFRYKCTVVLDGAAYIGTWVLIIWANGEAGMKGMQVVHGLATAGEVGYYSYLYAMLEKEHYRKVASLTRCSSLFGRFSAYLFGQFCVSYGLLDLLQLNMLSLCSVALSFLIAIFLPTVHVKVADENTNVKDSSNAKNGNIINYLEKTVNNGQVKRLRSAYEHTMTEHTHSKIVMYTQETKDKQTSNIDTKKERITNEEESLTKSITILLKQLLAQLGEPFCSRIVILWSLWWVLVSCGSLQMGSYIQNLWDVIARADNGTSMYNGAVEAAGTLSGSVSVVAVGFLPVDWSIRGRCETLMASVCAIKALLSWIMAWTDNLWVAYVLFDLLRMVFHVTITVETTEIAKALTGPRYGLVFGCNMFLALIVETVFTAVVVDKAGFGVNIRTQFAVYAVYSAVMFAAFGIFAVVTICCPVKQARDQPATPSTHLLTSHKE